MRLIDADALTKSLQDVLDQKRGEENTIAYITFGLFIVRLKLEPTIDAVPVVRCKDCKHLNAEYRCVNWRGLYDYTKADDFCSYGERSESND